MSNQLNSSVDCNHNAALLLGVPVDNVNIGEAVERIDHMVTTYEQDRRPRYVATVNVDFLVKAMSLLPGKTRDPELLDVLRKADLVTADGAPLILLSKLTGQPLKQRVTGADLVLALAEHAAEAGHRIYLLGADRPTAEKAADVLLSNHPELRIVGVATPFVHVNGSGMIDAAESDRAIVDEINAARPDILLLAFGNPKQEIWFERNRYNLDVPVSIGIGGTLSFVAGTVKRAPQWIQSLGLEWIYRIIQEPRRLWKRYAEGLVKFGLMTLPSMLLRLTVTEKIPIEYTTTQYQRLCSEHGDSVYRVRLPRHMRISDVSDLNSFCQQHSEQNIVFDFADVECIELNSLARLIRLITSLQEHQGQKIVCGVSRRLKRRLTMARGLTGLDAFCCSDSFSQVLKYKFPLHTMSRIWCTEHASGGELEMFPQGDLVNTSLARDPFGFQVAPQQFQPIRIHFGGIGKIDNAALVYLLDGIRRHGARKIHIIDGGTKLSSLYLLANSVAKAQHTHIPAYGRSPQPVPQNAFAGSQLSN